MCFVHEKITIEYLDENFNKKTEVFDGLIARVIQHEYDHIEGDFIYRSSFYVEKEISR